MNRCNLESRVQFRFWTIILREESRIIFWISTNKTVNKNALEVLLNCHFSNLSAMLHKHRTTVDHVGVRRCFLSGGRVSSRLTHIFMKSESCLLFVRQ